MTPQTNDDIATMLSGYAMGAVLNQRLDLLQGKIKEALDIKDAVFAPHANFDEYQKAWEDLDDERKARIHSLEAEVERYKRIFSDVDVENPDAVNIMISAMKEHWEYIKSLKVALYDIKGLHTACGQCSISSDDRECLTFNLAKQALSRLKSGGGA